MKTRLFAIAMMASAAFFIRCGQTSTESADEVKMMSVDEMKTPTTLAVKIEGMSCPNGCAAKIQEDCGKLTGIGASEVNFEEGMGYFTFDASVLSQEDILKCISNANGGGIYSGTVVEEDVEVESDEATTEEALHEVKTEHEAHS
jgi:copper chaperone CopZ